MADCMNRRDFVELLGGSSLLAAFMEACKSNKKPEAKLPAKPAKPRAVGLLWRPDVKGVRPFGAFPLLGVPGDRWIVGHMICTRGVGRWDIKVPKNGWAAWSLGCGHAYIYDDEPGLWLPTRAVRCKPRHTDEERLRAFIERNRQPARRIFGSKG